MTRWCVIWSYQNIAVYAGILHAASIAKAFLTLHENITWHYSNINAILHLPKLNLVYNIVPILF